MSIKVNWQQNLEFVATTEQGHRIQLDANSDVAPCPTEMLLSALGSCSATDVVMGLQEAAVGLQSLTNDITYTSTKPATDNEPQLYKTVNLHFTVTADNVGKEQVAQIVEQAISRYCHVCLMLQPSMVITHSVSCG
ncbi:MAG TPA: osmotically inducible protein OsmC [Oceanospirillaceae bacterium]|nr:osmotically inducible protein OsmC [Oceanospirillaceae bacterium]